MDDSLSVRIITSKTGREFVKKYHYAHRAPSCVVAFGLYKSEDLIGVITYGIPASNNVRLICGEEYKINVLELTRLFIFDVEIKNIESWFIARTFELLRQYFPHFFILVSYADTDHDHVGYVYQATNWIYTGTSSKGGPQEYIVDGIKRHTRWVNHNGGVEKVRNEAKEFIPVKRSIKHRYVYFLKKRRKMMHYLKFERKDYPKLDDNIHGVR